MGTEVGRRDRIALRVLALVALSTLPSCGDDATGPGEVTGDEIGVVVNSLDVSLTIFSTESPDGPVTVGLAPAGSPVGLAIRGSIAAVPLGFVPAVAIVDLDAGIVLRTVALPEGSGATGAGFVNDSIVLVANPSLNTVSAVNVRSGLLGVAIEVGGFPQAITVVDGRAFVLNAELGPDFLPRGPGSLSVIDGETLRVVATISLSGENPSGAVLGPTGRLHVVNAGRFGEGDGSLSVVDVVALRETAHHEGFGEFPASPAFGPDGSLYVSSFAFGLAIWSPGSTAFVRSPVDAVMPEDVGSSAGVGFDRAGRLYALRPDCANPSAAIRLSSAFVTELAIPTGICPISIAFAELPR